MQSRSCETLIEVLEFRAQSSRDQIAFMFKGNPTTYGNLWESVNRFATGLVHLQVKRNERVIVALPNGEEFFIAFYGIQRAGGIAVPIYPNSGIERIITMADLCGAKIIILPKDISPDTRHRIDNLTGSINIRFLNISEFSFSVDSNDFPRIEPSDISFIQYTSGSTGNPKGIPISHHNLITNINQMITGMQITLHDIFVSWLPVYHDMGLILMTMVPLYLGSETHLLPSDLSNPKVWLEIIQQRNATFTAAPDFAYRLCLRKIEHLDQIDLTSLRVALNAAEPVRAQTVREFENAFHLKNVMAAGYGLAEATVGVSMSEPNQGVTVDSHGMVSVGKPFAGIEIKIVDRDKELQPGEIGEISIRSIANSNGYWNNQAETQRVFQKDGFLLSGDLGYLDGEGNLFISGRKKSMIKHMGETVSPQEIEEAVDQLTDLRYSAAIGIDRGGPEGEQIFVFMEIHAHEKLADSGYHDLCVEAVEIIYKRLGFRPARIYLLKPRSIPRTYNGKIQRYKLKQDYLSGMLRSSGKILYPEY